MEYRLWKLSQFKKVYLKEMIQAQKEIYPNEPEVTMEDSIPFEENSYVLFALDRNDITGFCAFCICKEARNSQYFGSNLYFYVKPEYRKKLVAGELLKGTEAFCANKGCKYFKWDVNKNSDLIKAFNKRPEYKKESIIYSKNLI